MLTLFTAAAVLAACAGLRWVFEPPGAEGRIFLGRTHPIDGPVE